MPPPQATGRPVPGVGNEDLRVAVSSKTGPDLQKRVESALFEVAPPRVVLVSRAEQDDVSSETQHQISGVVADETAVSIGAQLGANLLLVAEETASRDILWPGGKSRYALRLTAVDPESGAILGLAEADVVAEQVNVTSCTFECARKTAIRLAVKKILSVEQQ